MTDMPRFVNKKTLVFGEIIVDSGSGASFKPYMDRQLRDKLGYSVESMNLHGKMFVYIAPDHSKPIGSTPSFCLYIGPHGDPEKDHRLGPFNPYDYA